MDRREEQFTQLLLASQPRLKVYIRAMVGDRPAADDILQQTNLVLCRKSEQYASGTDFGAWAVKVAHFEVLKQRQRFVRSRLIFDESLAEAMADAAAAELRDFDDEQRALSNCLGELSPVHRELVRRRYGLAEGVEQVAQAVGRPVGSIRQTLYRIRQRLADCIRATVPGGGA